MPTLYVDVATGLDSRTYLEAQNPATPWASIGRAAWGSTNRAVPNAAQAATAGDTVVIAGGVYATATQVNARFEVVYNPVNEGAPGNLLTFVANGVVFLYAPAANGPVVGSAGRDYVKWYADVTQGHRFDIVCDGDSITGADSLAADTDTDTKADPTVVNTRADTGPAILHDCVGGWLEGFDLDGGHQINYTDNWDGIRTEAAVSFTLRNNRIHGFHNQTDSTNGAGIKLYYSSGGLVEHNHVYDCGSGVVTKDVDGATVLTENNHVRLNRFENLSHGAFGYSVFNSTTSKYYQNLVIGCEAGVFAAGNNLVDVWIFNNTFVACQNGTYINLSGTSSGTRLVNNIFASITNRVVEFQSVPQPAATAISHQHNLYHSASGGFYSGSDGSRDYASYSAAYPDQNVTAPASVVADPLFVDAGAGNYRLQAGSPARNLAGAVTGFSFTHAGCYQTGDEVMGVEGLAGATVEPVRLTQAPAETLVASTPTARVTQLAVESALAAVPTARLTQVVVELLFPYECPGVIPPVPPAIPDAACPVTFAIDPGGGGACATSRLP